MRHSPNLRAFCAALLFAALSAACVIEDKGCDDGIGGPVGDAQQEMINRWGEPELLYLAIEDTEYVKGVGAKRISPRRVEYWGYPTAKGKKLLFDSGYFVQTEAMASLGLSSPLRGVDPKKYHASLTPQKASETWGLPDRDETETILGRDVRMMSWYLEAGKIPRQLTFIDDKLRGAVVGLLAYDPNGPSLGKQGGAQ